MKKYSRTEEMSSAVRYVLEQPMEFTRFNNGVKQYNLRKLNHLPYHLAKAKRFDELNSEVVTYWKITLNLWCFILYGN